MGFEPNELSLSDLEGLEDWQLLVAACHFGPKMTDCVDLNYSYRFDGRTIYVEGYGRAGADVSLDGDIEISNPLIALEGYAGITWQQMARELLKKALTDDAHTDN